MRRFSYPIFGIILLTLLFTSCADKVSKTAVDTRDFTKLEFTDLKGRLVREQFVNKANKPIEGAYDYYLKTKNKKYFIKFCESKVDKSDILSLLNKDMEVSVYLTEGEWDRCDENEVQSRIGKYISIMEVKTGAEGKKYIYHDGSGNGYIIENKTITYDPVTKEESSTGEYSGGTPATKELSLSDLRKVNDAFTEVMSIKEIQIENRIMTSGQLQIIEGDQKKKVIISKGKEMNDLEVFLKRLLEKQ